MDYIRENKTEEAYRILKRAEALCVVGRFTPSVKYRVSVLNNLGCCMRRFGKYKVALNYLQTALKIVNNTNSGDLLATTCLNLCAVYRQLEDHQRVASVERGA